MSPKDGATILVKKPDGTLVRVPLSDLVKKKTSPAIEEPAQEEVHLEAVKPVQKIESAPREKAEVSISEQQPELSSTSAQDRAREVQPEIQTRISQISKKDNSSLLDEELERTEPKTLPPSYDPQLLVDEIMQELPVSVTPELQMRMRQAVSSLVRGVRDPRHFHETVVKSVADGGLGLTDEQAARIVVVADNKKKDHDRELKRKMKENRTSQSKFTGSQPSSSLRLAKDVQEVPREPQKADIVNSSMALSTTTPVRNYFEDVACAKLTNSPTAASADTEDKKQFSPDVNKKIPLPANKLEAFRSKMPSVQSPRTASVSMQNKIMHDMRAPHENSRTMGPVEEMERFALADLRRLSSDPDRAAERVVEKLMGWKEESYMLYLETRAAWFRSPLFKMYQHVIGRSIEKNQTIDDFLRTAMEQNGLHPQEIRAMVEINRRLTV